MKNDRVIDSQVKRLGARPSGSHRRRNFRCLHCLLPLALWRQDHEMLRPAQPPSM